MLHVDEEPHLLLRENETYFIIRIFFDYERSIDISIAFSLNCWLRAVYLILKLSAA